EPARQSASGFSGPSAMTEVKTFRAESMQEALDLVRREMGADAVILHTRQVTGKQMLPWQKPRTEVEITAGNGIHIRPLARPATAAVEARQTASAERTASPASFSPEPPPNAGPAQLLTEVSQSLQSADSSPSPV